MRRCLLTFVLALGLSVVVVVGQQAPLLGQEAPTTAVPAPDIVPKPNSGSAPAEAGDRGGALQLAVLGLVILAIGGSAVHLTRQARRARDDRGEDVRP
ncbi:MAG: hypothetical protein ACOYXM_02920 [Actinomycetota bacterium]